MRTKLSDSIDKTLLIENIQNANPLIVDCRVNKEYSEWGSKAGKTSITEKNAVCKITFFHFFNELFFYLSSFVKLYHILLCALPAKSFKECPFLFLIKHANLSLTIRKNINLS